MAFPKTKPPSSRTVMRQVGKLCRGPLQRAVKAFDADRCVKRYDTTGFAMALIAFFLLGLSSMRELQARLKEDTRLQHVVGWGGISVSQLIKLMHARSTQIWQGLIADLLQRVPGKHRCGTLRIMDTSFWAMGPKLMRRLHPGKAMGDPATSGFKLCVLLDPDSGMPVRCSAVAGQGCDTAHIDALAPPDEDVAGLTFLFDRGFRKYSFFDRLIARGAHFVTLATQQISWDSVSELPLDPQHPEIIRDRIVRLGGPNSRSPMKRVVRLIELEAGHETLQFLASDLEQSAVEICDLYRTRWEIEPFFRWLKSGVGCRRPLGYSLDAALHTFFAALVVYLITLLFAQRVPSRTSGRMTFSITATLHTIRARLHEPVSPDDLQALQFL